MSECINCKEKCKNKRLVEGINCFTNKKELQHFRNWTTKQANYTFKRHDCSCGCKNPVGRLITEKSVVNDE